MGIELKIAGLIYVVRHGEVEGNVKGVYLGGEALTEPLDKDGREQAEWLRSYFAGVRFDTVLSSPAKRCVQTISPTAEDHGLDIEINRLLLEKGMGSLDRRQFGGSKTEVRTALYLGKGLVHGADGKPELIDYEGEKIDKVYQRALMFRRLVCGNYSDNVVVSSTHGFFASVLGNAFANPVFEEGFKLKYDPTYNLKNGCGLVFEINGDNLSLVDRVDNERAMLI